MVILPYWFWLQIAVATVVVIRLVPVKANRIYNR